MDARGAQRLYAEIPVPIGRVSGVRCWGRRNSIPQSICFPQRRSPDIEKVKESIRPDDLRPHVNKRVVRIPIRCSLSKYWIMPVQAIAIVLVRIPDKPSNSDAFRQYVLYEGTTRIFRRYLNRDRN